jgi:hypothetical protein
MFHKNWKSGMAIMHDCRELFDWISQTSFYFGQEKQQQQSLEGSWFFWVYGQWPRKISFVVVLIHHVQHKNNNKTTYLIVMEVMGMAASSAVGYTDFLEENT